MGRGKGMNECESEMIESEVRSAKLPSYSVLGAQDAFASLLDFACALNKGRVPWPTVRVLL